MEKQIEYLISDISSSQKNIYIKQNMNNKKENMSNILINLLLKIPTFTEPNKYLITAEDIYGEDSFDNDIQVKLNADKHITSNIFYDAEKTYCVCNDLPSNIIFLKNTVIADILSIFSNSLFTYAYILITEKDTTLTDIHDILREANSFENVEKAILEKGILFTTRNEGETLVIKCLEKHIESIISILNEL